MAYGNNLKLPKILFANIHVGGDELSVMIKKYSGIRYINSKTLGWVVDTVSILGYWLVNPAAIYCT